jgi:predicted homoserine dehydrogenase-like protein
VAAAKIDLQKGQELDGIGWYMTYGLCENADTVQAEGLLPLGLAEGCRLKRDVARDEVLLRSDVEVPEGRLVDRLRAEQESRFSADLSGAAL